MDTPAISVALPVYNGENYIAEAIESILAQDFEDFELVISDTASTDATPAIVSSYAARDSRVKLYRLEEKLPQQDNVNRSIQLSRSNWVKLFCHDDLMFPNCLSTIRSIIAGHSTDRLALIGDAPGWLFANGYRYSMYENNSSESCYWNGADFVKAILDHKSHDPLPALTTATVRRDAFLASGGFETRFLHFDTFFWIRFLLNWDYIFIPSFLTITRIHGAQVQVNNYKMLRTVTDHKKFWPEFVAETGERLHLGGRARLFAQLKGISTGGSLIALQLLKGNPSGGLQIAARLPIYWWPLLPFFTIRTIRSESVRIGPFRDHISMDMIYPA